MNKEHLPLSAEMRPYAPGDEDEIVSLLSVCYGEWGDACKWKSLYSEYPGFRKEDVFIVEDRDTIIGHRGVHFRELVNRQQRLLTALLGDTAIRPDYRGKGLYSKLHDTTLEYAKKNEACFAFTWNLQGSVTYEHNRKTFFAELEQRPAYLHVLNPERVLKSGIADFLRKNGSLTGVLRDVQTNIRVSIGETDFFFEELLNGDATRFDGKLPEVTIYVDRDAVSHLAGLRAGSSFSRVRRIAFLVAGRKIRIRFSSPVAFWRLFRKGAAILGSL